MRTLIQKHTRAFFSRFAALVSCNDLMKALSSAKSAQPSPTPDTHGLLDRTARAGAEAANVPVTTAVAEPIARRNTSRLDEVDW
jgi:hypothetical protein